MRRVPAILAAAGDNLTEVAVFRRCLRDRLVLRHFRHEIISRGRIPIAQICYDMAGSGCSVLTRVFPGGDRLLAT